MANVISAFKMKSFSMGKLTSALEEKLASFLGVPYVVMTNSGTSALTASLLAGGVQNGDEVIVPALTWIATAQAAAITGAKVVLADCLPQEPVIDLDAVKEKITRRTKAIIAVHLNGRACAIERLREFSKERGLFLVEDACKAMASQQRGKYLGTFGDVGCFSMGMVSLISTGYGGFVAISNPDLHEKIRLIRDHGVVREPEEYRYFGLNMKISDLLAAIGLAQFDQLTSKIDRVLRIYKRYSEALVGLKRVKILSVDIASGKLPLYTEAYSDHRDEVVDFLKERNIGVSKFHLPMQKAKYFGDVGSYPNAENFSSRSFVLPSGPSQPLENVDRCIEALRAF